MKKTFINILAINLIGILLFPITGAAHRAGGDNPPEEVHRVIEVLFQLDPEDVPDEVTHNHNNYGARPHNDPNLCDGYRGGHSGYDVAHGDDNARFYSLTTGEVTKIVQPDLWDRSKLSYIVVYNTTHDKTVLYLHPSEINVEIGDTVKVGTQLGRQGNTGNSTNPHVHLEVRNGLSRFPSCGIGAPANNPNENPIPFLYEQITPQVQVTPVIDRLTNNRPDLVIESVEPESITLEPGEEFRLYSTLKNQGTVESEATKFQYYFSTNDRISLNDTRIGRNYDRPPLDPNETIRRFRRVTVPTTPGTYYYGVCVDSVDDETNTRNNCSEAIEVIVRSPDANANNADVDGNGIVDVEDLIWVAEEYGQKGNNDADVNGDRVVDINDLILVTEAIDDAAEAPAIRSQMQALFTAGQLQELLTEAKALENISLSHQRGLALLEQLFRLSTPKKTSLLANYPNPFNPETWIPYQLAESVKVTLTIYTADGRLIRTLTLGYQPAGVYQRKNRAAYWDGKNEQGESVASGVYFYTLTAGDFTATRKLLIRK